MINSEDIVRHSPQPTCVCMIMIEIFDLLHPLFDTNSTTAASQILSYSVLLSSIPMGIKNMSSLSANKRMWRDNISDVQVLHWMWATWQGVLAEATKNTSSLSADKHMWSDNVNDVQMLH